MQILFWFLVPQLLIVGLVVWLYRMPDHRPIPALVHSAWSRAVGTHRRLLQGKDWEPGEDEYYRTLLAGATAYSVDHHIPVQGRATCLVTSHRMILTDAHGPPIQLLPQEIRAVRVGRSYEPAEGFSFWVVIERVGRTVPNPEGDLRLDCASQETSRELAAAIDRLRSTPSGS